MEYNEVLNYPPSGGIDDQSTFQPQHVSVRESMLTRDELEYSPLVGHCFLLMLCLRSLQQEETCWNDLGWYSAVNWKQHILHIKKLTGDNFELCLEEHTDLKEAVDTFLGGEEASDPFASYSKVMTKVMEEANIQDFSAGEWISEPAAFARIELDLPLDNLNADALQASNTWEICVLEFV